MRATVGLAVLVGTAVAVVSLVDPSGGQQADRGRPSDPTIESSPPLEPLAEPATPTTTKPLPVLGPAQPLRDLDGWLQSDIESLDELRGKVVVVQFWTFSCRNCKNTLPHLQELYRRHGDEEFEIVGVHAPEFDFEREASAVAVAAQDLGVTWPIALDTAKRNFFGWQGSPAYWPRTYVLDRAGMIRFDHIGEGAYDELAATVASLLDTN